MEKLNKYRCMLEVFIDVEAKTEDEAADIAAHQLMEDLQNPESYAQFIVWEQSEVTVP